MTTLQLPNAVYGSRCQSRRRNLLDRFWDAVHLDSPESPGDDDIFFYGPIDGYDEPPTPEIFSRFGSTPTIDVKSAWSSSISPLQYTTYLTPSIFVQPPAPPTPVDPVTEDVKRHFWSRSPAKTPTSRWPKLSIPQDLKPRTPGISSPATAILNMASNFLDDIVKLTRAQSPSSNTTVIGSPDGDIEIIDSEVHINVIDDGKRAGIFSTLELEFYDDDSLEKLDIPPAPVTVLAAPEINYDIQSPYTVNGPAENARELDALSHMDWERQLSNLNGSFWH